MTGESEFPGQPDRAPDLGTAIAWALAAGHRRSEHGQLCPVWTRRSHIGFCDCWIVSNAKRDAEVAMQARERFFGNGGANDLHE